MAEQSSSPPNHRPLPTSGGLTLRVAQLSDVGRARDHQEDSIGIVEPSDPAILQRKGRLYLVADGMGGHNAGEVASQMAAAEIPRAYYADPSPDIPTALTNAVASANQAIIQHAQAAAGQIGMGTTATLAVVREREVIIGNVGDSRTYLLRNGALTQVTQDHSLVAAQERAGVLTPEQARNHPQRNVITRALGKTDSAQPDFFNGSLQVGDTLILCSDGLSTMVTDNEIQDVVGKSTPADAVRRLVDLANERGGLDNISVILVHAEASGGSVQAMPAVLRAAAEPARTAAARRFPLWLMAAAAVIVLMALAGIMLLLQTTRTRTAEPTSAAAPPQGTMTREATATLAIGDGARPTATLAAVSGTAMLETATLAPSPTPTATQPTSAPASPTTRPTQSNQLAPVLLNPGNATIVGDALQRFVWDWSGQLQPGQGFQVLLWKGSNSPTAADRPVIAKTGDSWEQTIRLSQAPAVKQGGDGTYSWTVALIQVEPYKQLAGTPMPRSLNYQAQKPTAAPTRMPTLRPPIAPTVDLRPTISLTPLHR